MASTSGRIGTSRRLWPFVTSSRRTPREKSTRSHVIPRFSPLRIPVSLATVTMACRSLFSDAAHSIISRASWSRSSQRTRPSGSRSSLMTGALRITSHSISASRKRCRKSASGRLMLALPSGLALPCSSLRRTLFAARRLALYVAIFDAVRSRSRVVGPKAVFRCLAILLSSSSDDFRAFAAK